MCEAPDKKQQLIQHLCGYECLKKKLSWDFMELWHTFDMGLLTDKKL
jgi:hypothetical protein